MPRIIILPLLLALATACVGGPRAPLMTPLAAGAGYGYAEREIDGPRHEVSYLTPFEQTWLSREKREADIELARRLAHDLALWRAAQLALEQGYPAFAIVDERVDVEVNLIDEGPIGYDPFFGPAFGFHHPGISHLHPLTPSFRSAWLQVKATLTVDLLAVPAEGAHDAAATIARLESERPQALLPR